MYDVLSKDWRHCGVLKIEQVFLGAVYERVAAVQRERGPGRNIKTDWTTEGKYNKRVWYISR